MHWNKVVVGFALGVSLVGCGAGEEERKGVPTPEGETPALLRSAACERGLPQVLTGTVVLPELPAGAAATPVRITLEDVSLQDAPSVQLALAQAPVPLARALTFALCADLSGVDARAFLDVRAHVDHDGDGAISRGDGLSTRSHPVITRGYPSTVTVEVERI